MGRVAFSTNGAKAVKYSKQKKKKRECLPNFTPDVKISSNVSQT